MSATENKIHICARMLGRYLAPLLSVFFLSISLAFGATLPSGYTELEYIESTGTQCIDTGYKWTTDVTETELEYFLNTTQWGALFGSEVPSPLMYGGVLYLNTRDGNPRVSTMFGSTQWLAEVAQRLNVWESYKAKTTSSTQGVVTYNGTETPFTYSGGLSKVYSMAVFCSHKDDSYQQFTKARIRKFKMKDNGTLVRDLIPAKRNSDGAVGMYDTVTNTFFENAGTGTFIAGPVGSSCGYTELEYLELQGEAYFNTNVYLSKDMDIEFEFMPTQLSVAGTVIGVRAVNTPGSGFDLFYNINHPNNGTNTLIDFFGVDNSTGRWAIKSDGLDYVLVNNKKYKLSIVNKVGTFSADGVVIDTHTYTAPGTSPITIPLYIHTFNNAGNVGSTNDIIRFYHYSATGVADIVPVKRDCDNVLGLYNKTTGEFLEKIGSGTLVAGPVVGATVEQGCEYTRLEYLKSSNTQYIQDDSFQTIGTGAIEIKTKDLQTYTRFAGWDGLVALATPNSVTNYFPFLYGSWDDYNPNPVSIAAENALRYEFEPGLQKLYVNGVFNRQAQKNTSIYSAPFRMFIVSTGGGYNHGSTIYYCRVFDANNVLLRNYVPVKRNSDNVLGMYDTVTGTFFTNKGSGTFTAGPEIVSGDICSTTITIHWDGLSEPEASGMCVYGETFTVPSTIPTADAGYKFIGWMPR